MVRTASVLVFLSWMSLCAGCRPYYLPPAANAPLLGHGGELHAAAQLNSSVGQADVQLAFAPMDYFGIQAALSLAEWRDNWHKHSYGEVGAGTFIPFGIGRFEAFLGGGYGDAMGKGVDFFDMEDGDLTVVQGPYRRLYFQMDIGLSTKIVDFGLMSRWSWIRADLEYSSGADQTTYGSFLEEIVFLRVGYDPVKAEFQGGWIWPTTNELRIEFIPWHFSIGLHVKFDLWGGDQVADDEEDEEEEEGDAQGEAKPASPPPADGDGWKEVKKPGFGRISLID